MNEKHAEHFFSTVKSHTIRRYTDYWESIKPATVEDVFRRYLFAFMSVHTTWESNVRGYNYTKDLGWTGSKDDLLDRLINARVGLHNNRVRFIWDFKEKFYSNPSEFCGIKGSWKEHRNHLVKSILGLGMAKVSFALEMCFPNQAHVTCIDTHGIKLYELSTGNFQSRKGVDLYQQAEAHWVSRSLDVGATPTITRAIYWDRLQKRRSPRYWTYVLE